MRHIIISPDYGHLRDFIDTIPERMQHEGTTIYEARNLIKVMQAPDGTLLNVKRYHRPALPNNIVYSTGLRTPKGMRAYRYPTLLLSAGIDTPEPVAYIEDRHCGLLGMSYFISLQCPYPHRLYEVAQMDDAQSLPLARAFATFTAHMHDKGFMHKDYSPGNILWQKDDDGSYHFSLVDINRMYFGKVDMTEGCRNFRRLWGNKMFFEECAKTYAAARGMDEKKCVDLTLEARKKFWTSYLKRHDVEYEPDL